MADKEYWVGISLKVMAEDETEAGETATSIAKDLVFRDIDVIDAFWDNNLPEEEYYPEEEKE